MKGTIPYIAWRERIKELTPENHRIDDDLILLDNIPYGEISKKPMKAMCKTIWVNHHRLIDNKYRI